MNLSQQQRCLLDVLFRQQPLSADKLDRMDENDWDSLLTMLHEHRLAPLLHSRFNNELKHLNVPDKVREQLKETYRTSSFRSLALQHELLQLHHLLNAAGIEYAALKGAYLAFNIYPHAALRPMRDLDVLVSSDDLLPAYERLLAAGYQRPSDSKGDLEAIKKIGLHLPPLLSPKNRIFIELHHRFMEADNKENKQNIATDALWSRRVHATIADNAVSFLSETDLLLHLIDHAVYHHYFDNGALIFSDITYLLKKESIDWVLFWQLAIDQGVVKGCCLVLKMVQCYDHSLDIKWLGNEVDVPEGTILTASLMSLVDLNQSKVATKKNEYIKNTIREKVVSFWKSIFRSRHGITCLYPVKENSPMIYFYYLLNFWRLSFSGFPLLLNGIFSRGIQDTEKNLKNIKLWLIE